MVALPRGSLLKLSAVTILSLISIVVIHQVSYTESFALTNETIDIIDHCPPSTTPSQPDDDPQEPTNATTTIPGVIHQIWKTADVRTYPAPASHASWKSALEPLGYTVKLWTDADVLALVRADYPWLLATYEGYPHAIQRADLARLVVLHAEGGVYADLDVHPRPAAAAASLTCLRRLAGLQAAFAPTDGSAGLSNHFFAAARGSEFLEWALREAKRRGGAAAGARILLPYLRVFWSTGPLMLTSAFREYAWMYDDGAAAAASGRHRRPRVVLLGEAYAGTVFEHATGRSWHGSDGRILNYFGDHVPGASLWMVLSCVGAVLGVFCVVRRCGGEPGGILALYRSRCCSKKWNSEV